jgi:hypothetical protein
MIIRTAAALLAGAAILLTAARPAEAQSSTPIDVSAGYQFTHVNASDGSEGANVPKGWTASVTGHLHPAVNIVGEVNGAYKDGVKRHSFLAGIRTGGGRSPATNEAVVFGQFLVGASRISGENALVLQPGIGLDIRGTSRFSTRLNVDYLIERADGANTNGFRIAAGLVFDLKR